MRKALCAVVLACAGCLAAATSAHAVRVYAVTAAAEPHLISFDLATPSSILSDVPITGVGAGETIHGIDLRARSSAAQRQRQNRSGRTAAPVSRAH